jgi:hypothetical protein
MTGTGAAGNGNGAQPRDPFAVDVEHALEVLRLAWGDAYDIRFESGEWTAVSRDDERRVFSGHTPDELNLAIRADWARKGTL